MIYYYFISALFLGYFALRLGGNRGLMRGLLIGLRLSYYKGCQLGSFIYS